MRWCRAGIWAKVFTTPAWSTFRRSMSLRFDGAKGVKRHMLVGFGDIRVAVVVTPANVQDRAAFPKLLRRAKRIAPTIAYV
jgi:hypothetical protein